MKRLREWLNGPRTDFQIVSDLHLEVGSQYISYSIPATAPYLILAGDIGCLSEYDLYLAFLARIAPDFRKILLVLGNHEFYNLTYEEGIEAGKRLEKESVLNGKLVLLHQGVFEVPNLSITILGCTLWSHIPNDSEAVVTSKVKDYKRIENWTVAQHNAARKSDLMWLIKETQAIQHKNLVRVMQETGLQRHLIIVTHHAPLLKGTSKPEHESNPWTCAFATDVLNDERWGWDGVKWWVFGHTHFSTEFREAGTGVRVVSNQRGYVVPSNEDSRERGQKLGIKSGFDVSKTISI
jgi:predicted phosphodiesterase